MWLIRRVTRDDSNIIFSWRNSPEVYRYLFTPKPVEISVHNQWFESVLANNLIAFYIASLNGVDIGTVRFDFEQGAKKAEVGIYLAPDQHGKGLGSQMLELGEKKAKEDYPLLKCIIAKVLPENIASEKMFLKTGYNKKFIQLEKNYE